ncbi:ABC transporter permease, partial [Clostridioides difficile]|nr:ABC transporter permease [Clostridioides difficile]
KLSIGMTICLALLGSVQAIIVSLMIITLSSNKLEGMAVTKLAALTLLGIPAPFFIDSYYQFSVGFLPSFWVAKAMQNETVLYFSIGLMVALVWYYFLTKRLFRKLAG